MVRSVSPQSDISVTFLRTSFTDAAETKVAEFIRERAVLRHGERLVVAVSGGPDSTALLVLLSRMRSRLGIDITVAHFDHMLRGRTEAAGDIAFVRNLAGDLKLPLVAGRGDVRGRARRAHQSIEDAARRLRYAYLAQRAKETRSTAIVVGHTLDDRAETILLHLIRGNGLDGLIGMLPRSPWPFGLGPAVARPLLALRREDTERYCLELGLVPRRDPSNDVPVATRNRIRHQLLPALREFNPRVEEALIRLAENAAEDKDYLETFAADAWRKLASRSRGRVSFPRGDLAALHPAIVTRLLRRAIAHLLGRPADLEAVHVRTLLEGLQKRSCRHSLPHGLSATVDSRSLSIVKGSPKAAASVPETILAVPGSTAIGRWIVEAEFLPPPADPVAPDYLEAYFDAEAVGEQLVVRSRHPGDRLRPFGLGGEKKIQDILVDAKVPAGDRDNVPLVCGRDGIVWVVGHRIDERYALKPASVGSVRLRFRLRKAVRRRVRLAASDSAD